MDEVTKNKPEISEFNSVDPAPPMDIDSIPALCITLCNENERMFLRMRALFALRNIGGNDAIDALVKGFSSKSALLKHEIAYVLGQMQDNHAIPALISRLSDLEEEEVVRHEAAEAIGAIGDKTCYDVLEKFLDDESVIVAESCEVSIDLLNWVSSNSFEY
tara:strand:- start:3285 stop:3767 length:483 start_codon:yes stop_codon:yes gene_type:complete